MFKIKDINKTHLQPFINNNSNRIMPKEFELKNKIKYFENLRKKIFILSNK